MVMVNPQISKRRIWTPDINKSLFTTLPRSILNKGWRVRSTSSSEFKYVHILVFRVRHKWKNSKFLAGNSNHD